MGMLAGAGLYAELNPLLHATVGDYEEISLPQLLGVNHWMMIIPLIFGGLLLFRWFENKGLWGHTTNPPSLIAWFRGAQLPRQRGFTSLLQYYYTRFSRLLVE
jgi:hypothetical protein